LVNLRNKYLIALWLAIPAAALFFYFFRRNTLQGELQTAFAVSLGIASVVYLLLGSLRAFTLIPSTYLIVIALPFFAPVPLFVLTVTGILISSALIYWFSEALHIEELVNSATKRARLERLHSVLERNELPIIVAWTFFPFAPTDVMCYACGLLRVNFYKFLLGVLIGEGAICALYIFLGDSALRFFQLK